MKGDEEVYLNKIVKVCNVHLRDTFGKGNDG
jgi:hypothetical protein